jgi:hypothetical protein
MSFKVKVMLQQTASRPVCPGVKPHLGTKTRVLLLSDSCGFMMWGILSDERAGLSFIIAAGSRQRSNSQVRIPRDSWPNFTVADSRLRQPWEPGHRIYIPQEQGVPVIPPGTGFHFRRLLRLAGLRSLSSYRRRLSPPYIVSARTA